jgi:isoleucyl-tRNA synthetase
MDVEISSADIPGCIVSSNAGITIALDITLSQELKEEGLAREFINRIQNLRKDKGFEVTDKISILIEKNEALSSAIRNNFIYICDEALAEQLEFIDELNNAEDKIELVDKISAKVSIKKQES